MVSLAASGRITIKPLIVHDYHSGSSSSNTNSRIIKSCNSSIPPPPPRKRQQPSIAEIERGIGAGRFRDQDTSRPGQGKNLFDTVLSNSIGKTEGSVEKRLRETGEWIGDRSEKASRSSGKNVLKVLYLWIVPIWLLGLLVAAGGIKLPFDIPALDDLLM